MKRLVALDMLRGYALVCIMIDHLPVSILRNYTLANFSVFDAAELFVLLSGFLVGMVWLNVERQDGIRAAQWRFARRAFEVWRALVIGGLLLALLSAALFAIDMNHTAVWFQYAQWVLENPAGYLGVIATLWLQPNLLDVLAVYVILIALSPIMVPLMRRWPYIFAIFSVALWWFGPLLNGYIPNHRPGGLLFNPFGWQMLFFTGVMMALFRKDFMPVLLRYKNILTVLAVGTFIFGSTIVIASKFGDDAIVLREALKQVYGVIDKWPLDGTRYLAILAASWLVAVLLAGFMERVANTGPGVALQEIGRGGLWSFIMCVLLSVLADAFQMNPQDQAVWRKLIVDIWAIFALWWLAALWLKYGAPWQKARKTKKAQAAG